MNILFLLSLIVAATMAASVYPEMSVISFENNMAHPSIRTHDPLQVYNSAVSSRQQPGQMQIVDYINILFRIKIFQLAVIEICLTNNQYCIPNLQNFLSFKLQMISVMLTCALSPQTCPCKPLRLCSLATNSEDGIPISFHLTETHVENIRAAIEMVISNPITENVDALFNLLMDLATTNISTSSIQDGQGVRQKQFTLPAVASKVASPFVPAAKSQMTTSNQDNIEFKADEDGLQISYPLSFPVIHPIVPYSHFEWPMYPELLRRHPVLV